MFVDLYDIGEYPDVIIPSSVAAKTYQPIVVSTAVDVINSKFVTISFILGHQSYCR
jgi:hypothetical protein